MSNKTVTIYTILLNKIYLKLLGNDEKILKMYYTLTSKT